MTSVATLRVARAADSLEMGRIHVAAWQVGYRDIMPASYLDALDGQRRGDQWAEILTPRESDADCSLGSVTTLAEVEGRVVGMSSYGAYRLVDGVESGGAPRFELWMLNVDPEHWGTGVAQALDAHARAKMALLGQGPTAALWVLDGNARGRRFYEKQGWAPDGERKQEAIGGTMFTELRYAIAL